MSPLEINQFKDEYGWLSNFHYCNGLEGPSVEHVYHAMKAVDKNDRYAILEAPSAAKAKAYGRLLDKLGGTRQDWHEVKITIMTNLIHAKFSEENNPDLCKKLRDTGYARLVEGNYWGDQFWGVCNGVGLNHLGVILMQRRTVLIEDKLYIDWMKEEEYAI